MVRMDKISESKIASINMLSRDFRIIIRPKVSIKLN